MFATATHFITLKNSRNQRNKSAEHGVISNPISQPRNPARDVLEWAIGFGIKGSPSREVAHDDGNDY